MSSPRRETMRQGLTFLVVGGASALVDAAIFWVLITIGVLPGLASALSFLSAFAVNYQGNRKLVFRVKNSGGTLARYVVLVAVNLVLSTGGVVALVAISVDPLLAKLITMVVVAAVNFVAMRLWVFREKPAQNPAEV